MISQTGLKDYILQSHWCSCTPDRDTPPLIPQKHVAPQHIEAKALYSFLLQMPVRLPLCVGANGPVALNQILWSNQTNSLHSGPKAYETTDTGGSCGILIAALAERQAAHPKRRGHNTRVEWCKKGHCDKCQHHFSIHTTTNTRVWAEVVRMKAENISMNATVSTASSHSIPVDALLKSHRSLKRYNGNNSGALKITAMHYINVVVGVHMYCNKITGLLYSSAVYQLLHFHKCHSNSLVCMTFFLVLKLR